uniref:ABC transporter n=1 Tax=Salvia miltiorrhiza TaxID=226208 RepID=A0A8E6YGN3_SALMI|nr:ABC transporter [Salvia miltiorrhiza]
MPAENFKSHSSAPITLKFVDVSFKIKLHESKTAGAPPSSDVENPAAKERTILNGITGTAAPGKILAILGPSGSGKSTLLNAIAGRLRGGGLAGKILYNNRKLTKSVQKITGFVAQDDVLIPHLTVRETLIFCSLLRLPASLPKSEKIAAVDSVIGELNLWKCAETVVGDSVARGISGGERRRVSIAHEMVVEPSLLILDEPTSGLDATAAYGVAETLGGLAARGKTVVASVHQPSSRAYQVFDELLVMAEGRCIYFGGRCEAMSYFESVGFAPSFAMNPADFLLDLANGICHVGGASETEAPNVREVLTTSYNTLLAPKVKLSCLEASTTLAAETHNLSSKTDWFNQFIVLLQRNLKSKKHEFFDSLRISQVMVSSLLAGLLWWRSDYLDVQDRLGLMFFISIFWGVLPSFNAVFVFAQDRAILTKERSSGMYALSSYFLARITGELQGELVLPAVSLCITYWMAGLKAELSAFAATLVVVLGHVLVSQGVGLAVGAVVMDARRGSVVVTVVMLAFVLAGGYYVHNLPFCGYWLKYVSIIFYCYELLVYVQYGDGESISSLLGCSAPGLRPGLGFGPKPGRDLVTCRFIHQDIQGQISPATSVAMLLLMFVAYRVLAYVSLSRLRA